MKNMSSAAPSTLEQVEPADGTWLPVRFLPCAIQLGSEAGAILADVLATLDSSCNVLDGCRCVEPTCRFRG